MPLRHYIVLAMCLTAMMVWLAAIVLFPHRPATVEHLPETITDAEFWKLIHDFSEPGGYFRSDNFVSNETSFQHVIPALEKQIRAGGVYLGVGPEQNFTYIAALDPKLAFIVDIRRQNMLLHLMYKALFTLSVDRREFLSRLFARQVPAYVSRLATAEQLFDVFDSGEADAELAEQNLEDILEELLDRHHFDLSGDDVRKVEFVYRAFVSAGPAIRYSSNQATWRRFPTYSELMLETDGTPENGGMNRSYLASEDNFQAVRKMQLENRIIPVVGDFAGDKALRSIGRYLREHGAEVSVFYTSNVEFYLFQSDDWRKFFNTVSALPVSTESLFIRSYFNNYGFQFPNPPGWLYSPPQSYALIDSIPGLVRAFAEGRIHNYFDVIRRSVP